MAISPWCPIAGECLSSGARVDVGGEEYSPPASPQPASVLPIPALPRKALCHAATLRCLARAVYEPGCTRAPNHKRSLRPASLDSRTNVRYHGAMDAPDRLPTSSQQFSLPESSRSPSLGHALVVRSSRRCAVPGSCGLTMPQAVSTLSGIARRSFAALPWRRPRWMPLKTQSAMGTISCTGISPSTCRVQDCRYRRLPPRANTRNSRYVPADALDLATLPGLW